MGKLYERKILNYKHILRGDLEGEEEGGESSFCDTSENNNNNNNNTESSSLQVFKKTLNCLELPDERTMNNFTHKSEILESSNENLDSLRHLKHKDVRFCKNVEQRSFENVPYLRYTANYDSNIYANGNEDSEYEVDMVVTKSPPISKKINDIHQKITKSFKSTESIRENSMNKLDSKFDQISKILGVLNNSKKLLQRSNSTCLPSRSESTNSFNIKKRFHASVTVSPNTSTPQRGPSSNGQRVKKVVIDPTEESTYQVKSNSNKQRGDDLKDDPVTACIKIELDSLKKDLERSFTENAELKKKLAQAEKVAKSRRKQAELWKILYERATGYIPEKELELIKVSNEIEKINYLEEQDTASWPESMRQKSDDAFKSAISMLNEENLSLKIKIERMQKTHASEMDKIRAEFDAIQKSHASELRSKSRQEQEKNKEIELLKKKIVFEEEKRDEIKMDYANQLKSAQVRFENELGKQNSLMQSKNEELINEIKKLNESVHTLQSEKTQLIRKYYADKERQQSHSELDQVDTEPNRINKNPKGVSRSLSFSAMNTAVPKIHKFNAKLLSNSKPQEEWKRVYANHELNESTTPNNSEDKNDLNDESQVNMATPIRYTSTIELVPMKLIKYKCPYKQELH